MERKADQLLGALQEVRVAQSRRRVEWQVVVLRVRDHVGYLDQGNGGRGNGVCTRQTGPAEACNPWCAGGKPLTRGFASVASTETKNVKRQQHGCELLFTTRFALARHARLPRQSAQLQGRLYNDAIRSLQKKIQYRELKPQEGSARGCTDTAAFFSSVLETSKPSKLFVFFILFYFAQTQDHILTLVPSFLWPVLSSDPLKHRSLLHRPSRRASSLLSHPLHR